MFSFLIQETKHLQLLSNRVKDTSCQRTISPKSSNC
uniref:Uncharacterized protein n=1 Tax=Rhizophora mucronata TaxID=61149 RepID=A0A2P2IN89_RHIMU